VQKKHVLLVGNEKHLLVSPSRRLFDEGYSVQVATDGRSGYETALRECFDLILLELTLPDMDGFDLCRDLLREGIRVPILILSARGQTLGAGDYLVKPFEPGGLLAGMAAALRGCNAQEGPRSYRFGPIEVDLARRQVLREHSPLLLLPLEYRLLCYFIEHRGATLSRGKLLDDVWGYDTKRVSRTVDVHISGLRRKIETDPRYPRYLLTIHQHGYKFVG
jgi:two-component system alkaline phosphatase synthesis response regulator PhoP